MMAMGSVAGSASRLPIFSLGQIALLVVMRGQGKEKRECSDKKQLTEFDAEKLNCDDLEAE
jgi:hypothetical protein